MSNVVSVPEEFFEKALVFTAIEALYLNQVTLGIGAGFLVQFENGQYASRCSCGWFRGTTDDRDEAENFLTAHSQATNHAILGVSAE